ncbi:MAG: hypothetical protein H6Q73_3452 [Firmicutes bacterium]|nr:hypothetical protein [Bacillota bacterium]
MAKLVNDIASFEYDGLIGGCDPAVLTENVTIVSGAGALKRGTVLGKITKGAITAAAKTAGNTGDGTCETLSLGTEAKVGVYKVACTTAATEGGTFSVIDPDGFRLTDATVGTAYTGVINFTLTDGSTDFVVGDEFDITVAAGSGKYKIVNSVNTDGSQTAKRILAYAVDATSADVIGTVYQRGMFNRENLIFGGTDTSDDHEDALKDVDILLTSEQ